ncbi:MAG: DMT family transporter [Bacteroidales bacterium]|nr:DMT family transporter [Bacteroidales bacterium]
MIQSHPGEFSAILVAIFWTITALSFESASKKVGSLPVNVIRLVFGFIFLSLLNLVIRNHFLPTDASVHNWIWLSVSGLIGFVIGDLFLFKSYTIIGSWFAMLMMTLAPPLAAVFGWIILDEKMDFKSLSGMALTLTGIALVLFSRDHENHKVTIRKPFKGILFAFLGALGQALGIVFSKYGMQDYSPFPSTQIRIITGIAGFVLIISLSGRWKAVLAALQNTRGMMAITTGSFFGPFLGVSFSLMAVKYTSAGIASTIMAMVPILIIPPSVFLFHHKITLREIAGTIISVFGVVIFFL